MKNVLWFLLGIFLPISCAAVSLTSNGDRAWTVGGGLTSLTSTVDTIVQINQELTNKTSFIDLRNSGGAGAIRFLNNSLTPIFTVSNSQGHLSSGTGAGITAPTVSACGTTPSITGTDNAARVTVGTGGIATSCTMTFGVAWTNVPVCHVESEAQSLSLQVAPSISNVVITSTVAFTASSNLDVICLGING